MQRLLLDPLKDFSGTLDCVILVNKRALSTRFFEFFHKLMPKPGMDSELNQ